MRVLMTRQRLLTLILAVLIPLLVAAAGLSLAAHAQATTIPGIVLNNANLRGGPGTTYAVVGKAPAGSTVNVVEANPERTWYRLSDGSWIAAFLVQLTPPTVAPEAWSVSPGQPAGIITGVTPLTATGSAPILALPAVTNTVVVSSVIPTGMLTGTVVAVTDGATVEVLLADGKREVVRYLGVAAPGPGEPGFAASAAANQQLVGNKLVVLVPEQTDRDADNRLLRHVYVPVESLSPFFSGSLAGIYANGQMIADGYAFPAIKPPDVSKSTELQLWAVDAYKARRGFWAGQATNATSANFAVAAVSSPLYSAPGADAGADALLAPNTPVQVIGRTQDGAWLQVRNARGDEGWVFAAQMNVTTPISQVDVTSSAASGPTPLPQPGQALVAAVTPLAPGVPTAALPAGQPLVPTPLPGQVVAPTPFPGQPGVATPFPGQPGIATPFPGQPGVATPFPGQPVIGGPTVISFANLRTGPGTAYPLAGTALANTPIVITGRNADATWLQTANTTWIAASNVAGVTPTGLPEVAAPPVPTAAPPTQPTPILVVPPGVTAPTPTITPTPSPSATPLGNPTPTATPIPPKANVRLIAIDRGNEWVILYNDGNARQDLTGWTLVSEAGDQRCPLSGALAPRESLRVWAQVGPDGLSCQFPQAIWENTGPDDAILLDALGKEVSRLK